MVALQDLALADVAEFGPPELSSAGAGIGMSELRCAGPALDKVALEVRKAGSLLGWPSKALVARIPRWIARFIPFQPSSQAWDHIYR